MVNGRGACKLPDGVNRFVSSALEVFDAHVAEHRHGGPCRLSRTPLMPAPDWQGAWR